MLKRLQWLVCLFIAFSATSQSSVNFNFPSGKYDSTLVVKIAGDFDCIYYSLDGSRPNKSSNKYKDSISINKTTLLKVRVAKSEDLQDSIYSKFYLIDFDKKFPVLAISADKKDFWSSSNGLFVKGENFYQDSNGHYKNCNYHKKWEKQVTMIYIEDSLVMNQSCGMKIFGESTRANQDKSFKLIARKKYGKKLFKHSFFSNKTLSKHKQLVVRASGNDFKGSRFKDVLSAYLVRNMGVDYMDYQPIQLFVNGNYWGVYNLREKINEHYIKYNKGLCADSVNIIMGKWVRQEGSAADYMKMYKWFNKVKTMDSSAFVTANTFLDIRNYINYKITQLFINNADSRGNVRYWNSADHDGKFRMILYDTDHGYGFYKRKFLEHSLSAGDEYWYNPPWSTRYLRKLMTNEDFKNQFLVQYAHHLNTSFNKDTVLCAIDYFKSLYESELPRPSDEIAPHLRNVPLPLIKWEKKVEALSQFVKLRTGFVKKELVRLFDLNGWFKLNVLGENGRVVVNNNLPVCIPFSGDYLQGTEFYISALDDGAFKFKNWSDGDTSRLKFINGNQELNLKPEYEFNAPPKLILDLEPQADLKVMADSNRPKMSNLFFWLGMSLLLLGFTFITLGIYNIKKARINGL